MDGNVNSIPHIMLADDAFSKWLGIEIIISEKSYCKLQLTVRKDMLNGFGIAHGGITYALADTTLAFASNNKEQKSFSIETSISHTRAVYEGDLLTAEAKELHKGKTISVFEVTITNQNKLVVALFKGTVFSKTELRQ